MTLIAVTGATGYIGWHVLQELRRLNVEPIAIVRESSSVSRLVEQGITIRIAGLDDRNALVKAMAGCRAVIHLAGAVDFDCDWRRFHEVNVVGTANVLDAARQAGVNRAVHCSSIVAVGASLTPMKLDETSKWNLGHLKVPYVTTKREAEKLALAANDPQFELVVVNPGSVIGPDDFSASEFGVMCRRFWRGRIPVHFGGGNCFVDVRDVAAGICAAWQRGRPGERYILGGDNRSMGAFFAALSNASREPIPRWRLPNAVGPFVARLEKMLSRKKRRRAYLSEAQARLLPWFFYFDSGKARRELAYHPRPLRQSIADAFAFWEGPRSHGLTGKAAPLRGAA